MSPGSPGGDEDRETGAVAGGARSVARWLRHLPARLLHPLRRRRARKRLEGARPDGPVLFVCHGNICRSPYAEAVLRRRARGRLEATSAGLMGPDRPPPETALEVAGGRGVELGGHRSRLVSPASLREAGLVVVMDPYQSAELHRRHGFRRSFVLGDLDPEPVRRRAIRDPIFQPAAVFEEVYGRIDRCLEELLDAMGLPGGPEGAGDEAEEADEGREDGDGALSRPGPETSDGGRERP